MKSKTTLLVWLYAYAALHIAGWIVMGNMNDNESWASAFHVGYLLLFLPLNVLNFLQIQLVWGTLNVFEARMVFGLFTDFALMTVVSVHLLYFGTRIFQRMRRRHTGAIRASINPGQ